MRVLILLVILSCTVRILAHEVRPGYLEITEKNDGNIHVLWKVPVLGNRVLSIMPEFSDLWLEGVKSRSSETSSAIIWRWIINPENSQLKEQTISIRGLDLTMTDVMVKVNFADGTGLIKILKPESPSFSLSDGSTGIAVLDYLSLGIEHILLGIDHLLFILGLMLLSKTTRQLLKTITAFTIGHSISLALASLGVLFVPEKPLAVVIALSILFLAVELIREKRGDTTLTIRKPWIVAFGFGIIHGIGFAGGLMKLGLPETAIPVALLFFNIGVEIGQVLFILLAMAMAASYRKMEFKVRRWGDYVPAYIIGSFAAFWFIGRCLVLLNI
jgi:hydrogenase/urease accessory protein HupE